MKYLTILSAAAIVSYLVYSHLTEDNNKSKNNNSYDDIMKDLGDIVAPNKGASPHEEYILSLYPKGSFKGMYWYDYYGDE